MICSNSENYKNNNHANSCCYKNWTNWSYNNASHWTLIYNINKCRLLNLADKVEFFLELLVGKCCTANRKIVGKDIQCYHISIIVFYAMIQIVLNKWIQISANCVSLDFTEICINNQQIIWARAYVKLSEILRVSGCCNVAQLYQTIILVHRCFIDVIYHFNHRQVALKQGQENESLSVSLLGHQRPLISKSDVLVLCEFCYHLKCIWVKNLYWARSRTSDNYYKICAFNRWSAIQLWCISHLNFWRGRYSTVVAGLNVFKSF